MALAAHFITQVESALAKNNITALQRQMLLKDMNDIIHNIRENHTDEATVVKIANFQKLELLEVKSTSYGRIYQNRNVIAETWYGEVNHNRDNDKPAMISYHQNGELSDLKWYINGENKRLGGKPSRESYYPGGKIAVQQWTKNSLLHRDGDKPAYVEYNEEGVIVEEAWYQENLVHRDGNKPARITRRNDGTIANELYVVKGIVIANI